MQGAFDKPIGTILGRDKYLASPIEDIKSVSRSGGF
jgi:hypothetical protein